MLLQHLRNFEWDNEPLGVFFIDAGMKVVSNPETDFFQDMKKGINIDNGHFFYIEKEENFSLKVKWATEMNYSLSQCGLMLRQDETNWAKLYATKIKEGKTKLTACIANFGNQDESYIETSIIPNNLFLKIEKSDDAFILSYSADDETYIKIRKFSFAKDTKKIKVGSYICNPQNADFEAILTYLDLSIR